MPDSVINLLIQLPIVGIFVWFILEWSKRIDANANKHEDLWREFQDKRDEQWREFLREERAHRVEAIGRLAEEIKSIAQQVNQLNGLLSAHDAASREARIKRRDTGDLNKP